ncbi:MAG TPA: dTMP kinase [Gemmataceae bacterium]|jgi:dTMP kinase|nr:dTMP kinase [Gemmataceae bacterium]
MFVSLDGLDGAGKSTQCRRLADWLRDQGHDVVECADPGGTHVGQVLRQVLLDPQHPLCLPAEALLFMASRAQLVADVIRPALAAGKSVVSDRYLLANLVYQGHAGGLDPKLLWTVGRLAIGDLLPDLTIVLDVPLDRARARRKKIADRMEQRGDEFFAKVRAGFLAEAQREPERIVVVDADRDADAVHADIVSRVASRGR